MLSTPIHRAAGWAVVGLSLLPALHGCAARTSDQDIARAIEDWRRPRALRTAATTGHHRTPDRDTTVAPAAVVDPPPPAASPHRRPVDGYIARAMADNPGIQSAAAEVRARLARVPQVTALPDPVLRTIIRPEPIQTAAGNLGFTLGVSQTIPLLAKLERSGDEAAAEARMALERLHVRRMDLVADVERAYWRIYRLDRDLELLGEIGQVLEHLAQVVEAQYQVGKVPQQDLLRVQTEWSGLRDEQHRSDQRRAAAAAALNQLIGAAPTDAVPTTGAARPEQVPPDLDRLLALAAAHNPELAQLQAVIERNRARVARARLGYWPDLTVGFEWNQVDPRTPFVPPINPTTGQRPAFNAASARGNDNYAITAAVNLPIWTQRIEGARRESRQELLASERALHDRRNQVAYRVFDAVARIEAQQHTLRVLEEELLPQARQTYEVALTGYQAGEAGFVGLIDHWRRWLDFERMRHTETADLAIAWADLQRAVGLELLPADHAPGDTE